MSCDAGKNVDQIIDRLLRYSQDPAVYQDTGFADAFSESAAALQKMQDESIRLMNFAKAQEALIQELQDKLAWKNRDTDNPYWQRIEALAQRQRAKGMETYGQGLESNPAAIVERLEYLEEELVDALMYLEWCKDYLLNG